MVTSSSLKGRALTGIPLITTAFKSDLNPYAEFEWVTSPTSFRRRARDASLPIAQQPATITSVVGTVKRMASTLDNRGSGPAIARSMKAEPPLNAPRGPKNTTPSQAARFSHQQSTTQKGPPRDLGKAPVHSRGAALGPPPQPSSTQPPRFTQSRTSSITPASVSNSWHVPDLVHPLRRPLIDNTGPRNAAARNQSFTQTLDHSGRAHFSQESTQNSETPPQHEAGQVRMPYSPTPGPSSRGAHPYTKPTTNVRSPTRGSTKTPGPLDGKNGMGLVELGTPRLHSTAAQEPVVAQSSRAAGKQPVGSASCSVPASSPEVASQALATNKKQACEACNRTHTGKCIPFCGNCGKRHQDTCHHCNVCSKWHVGECRYCEECDSTHYAECRECPRCNTWHVSWCYICKTCQKRHGHRGLCTFVKPPPDPQLSIGGSGEKVASSTTESRQPRKRSTPLPEVVAKQVNTPKRARTRGATTPITPGTATSTRSAEMPNNEDETCKHRQKDQECERCTCGCGSCHRPDRLCSKQRAKARAGKRKADSVDPVVKVEKPASETQLSLQPKKKKKPKTRDSVDPVVKVEESASHTQLSLQPKKKKKLRTRDSMGSWYDPIAVE